ncbi:MAG: hypothetical protein ABSD98_00770 [Candidatus Korobacteraceae bacterium]|jgi:hypothetical protein
MTLEQRAQQFWPVLAFAAREQKVVSYSLLSEITEFPETTGSVLHYIYCYCKQHHLPPLNAIVIDPVTGRPGNECLREVRDLSAQQSRVFLYDWLNHPVPSDEMFKQAMVKEEELERADAECFEVSCRC